MLDSGLEINGYHTELETRMFETIAIIYIMKYKKDDRSSKHFYEWLDSTDNMLNPYKLKIWRFVELNWEYQSDERE